MFVSKGLVFCLILFVINSSKCSRIRAAPYFMPLENNPPDVSEAIKISGIKQFILAFVLAPNAGGCVPTWDGNIKQKVSDDTKVLDIIKTIRSAGGDVSVSFGGYTGMELGNPKACADAQQLADAYQLVIDKYNLTNIDLDIEGDDLGDDDSEHKRFKVIKILKEKAKSKGKELFVSLTLPGTTVGMSDLARDEIRKAIEDGVVVDLYKIMVFDYGGQAAEQDSSVIRIMELAHQQLKQLRPDLSDAQVRNATGLILMNGHTDQVSELYTIEVFEKLIGYANDKDLGRVSFWALNRDRPCGNIKVGWVSGLCSSIDQHPYDFTKTLTKFESDTEQNTTTPKVLQSTTQHSSTTQEPTRLSTHEITTKSSTPQPTHSTVRSTVNSTVETSATTEGNVSTTPYISTSHVTFSPIIDDVDCRKAASNAHYPYKNDCHQYIRCYNKLAHLETCPKGTIYDTKLHLCNWPQSVDRPECK